MCCDLFAAVLFSREDINEIVFTSVGHYCRSIAHLCIAVTFIAVSGHRAHLCMPVATNAVGERHIHSAILPGI